jgi:hypothetical protein
MPYNGRSHIKEYNHSHGQQLRFLGDYRRLFGHSAGTPHKTNKGVNIFLLLDNIQAVN